MHKRTYIVLIYYLCISILFVFNFYFFLFTAARLIRPAKLPGLVGGAFLIVSRPSQGPSTVPGSSGSEFEKICGISESLSSSRRHCCTRNKNAARRKLHPFPRLYVHLTKSLISTDLHRQHVGRDVRSSYLNFTKDTES
ncbi:hypothetical protein PUN28_006878 [Cardiocondyla obscurior]|uniref:Uncharacterized protein n=1 Tax=Cardiocondyla obscurior TaxID=286306 RepID=A0AAW2G2D6_9HYME